MSVKNLWHIHIGKSCITPNKQMPVREYELNLNWNALALWISCHHVHASCRIFNGYPCWPVASSDIYKGKYELLSSIHSFKVAHSTMLSAPFRSVITAAILMAGICSAQLLPVGIGGCYSWVLFLIADRFLERWGCASKRTSWLHAKIFHISRANVAHSTQVHSTIKWEVSRQFLTWHQWLHYSVRFTGTYFENSWTLPLFLTSTCRDDACTGGSADIPIIQPLIPYNVPDNLKNDVSSFKCTISV